MKRRIAIGFLVAALLVPTASAGGAGESEKSGAGDQLVQKQPVKFLMRTNVGRESKPDNALVLESLQKAGGIQIEAVAIPNEAYKDRINLMIAAGEEFDGMNIVGYASDYTSLLERDAIIPLNDLLEKYGPNIKKVMADGLYSCTDKEGRIWALPRSEKFPEGYVPSIRKDWLDKLGMKMPTTLKEIEIYLEAVKTRDPNGNGQADEYGFVPDNLLYGMSNFAPFFIDANCSSLGPNSDQVEKYLDKKTGKVLPVYAHPNFRKMLELMRVWYQKGYMPKEIHVLKTTQINDLKSSNRAGMTAGWYSTGIRAATNIPGAQYEPIPPLKDALMISAWPSNPKFAAQTVIMKTSKNAAFLIKYFDWMLSDPQNLAMAQFGLEGTHWKWADKGNNQVELIKDAIAKYDQYYALANLFYRGIMPDIKVSPDSKIEYEYQRHIDIIRGFKMKYPFDSHIPYKMQGTPAENLTGDGVTLMNEGMIKYIIGTMNDQDWDKAVETFMKIDGNIRSEVWTKQYKEFTGMK